MSRSVGRDCIAVDNLQRMCEVALESEAMRFELRAIGSRREQVYGDVVRAMRSKREVEALGEMRDLHEHGHAAAVGDVGLGIGERLGAHEVRELVQRVEVL